MLFLLFYIFFECVHFHFSKCIDFFIELNGFLFGKIILILHEGHELLAAYCIGSTEEGIEGIWPFLL